MYRVTPKTTDKLLALLARYDSFLKRRFPTAHRTQTSLWNGFVTTFNDAKIYASLTSDRYYGKQLQHFNRHELDVLWHFPSDIAKVGPVMALLALPFATAVVVPLLLFYPRLMSAPFWTGEQRRRFAVEDLQRRARYYTRILSELERALRTMPEGEERSQLHQLLLSIAYRKRVVNARDLAGLQEMFRRAPLSLPYVRRRHAKDLARLHGLHLMALTNIYAALWPRSTLARCAEHFQAVDVTLKKDGVEALSDDELNEACLRRGLLPHSLSRIKKMEFIHQWLLVQSAISNGGTSPSLYLHLPIFLAYCHPANAQLFDPLSRKAPVQ